MDRIQNVQLIVNLILLVLGMYAQPPNKYSTLRVYRGQNAPANCTQTNTLPQASALTNSSTITLTKIYDLTQALLHKLCPSFFVSLKILRRRVIHELYNIHSLHNRHKCQRLSS